MTALDQMRQHVEERALLLWRHAADETVERTKAKTSRRTGALAESISRTEPAVGGTLIVGQIRADSDYALYQDEGTGIYGPAGRPITPKKEGGFLVFYWPAVGQTVWARQVRGAEGRKFFHLPMPDRWAESLASAL